MFKSVTSFWENKVKYWRDAYNRLWNKYACPAVPVDLSQAQWLKQGHFDLAFRQITAASMGDWLKYCKVIRPVADPAPWVEGEAGTVSLAEMGILVEDRYFMGWDLPAVLIHEAVHLYQHSQGLPTNTAGAEAWAYGVQQMFHQRTPGSQLNVFKQWPVPIDLVHRPM